jgi:hypothetical protein
MQTIGFSAQRSGREERRFSEVGATERGALPEVQE